VKIQESENQIVVDYEVYDQRPSDSDVLIRAIQAHQNALGRTPHLVAADAAFYSGKNDGARDVKDGSASQNDATVSIGVATKATVE
jgi:transposase, IS5 family